MSQRYSGGIITANPTAPTATSASGVWTLEQQFQNVANWPLTPKSISRSVRLRSSASAYFNRTLGSGNRQTWTLSSWVKRGALGSSYILQTFGPGGFGIEGSISFSSNTLNFIFDYNAGSRWSLITTAVYRDPSAWYHVVVVADTTNATSTDRLRIYVNGVRVTAFSTANYPTQNANGTLNQAYSHAIGADTTPSTFFDGYLTEVNFIDGQALTPSSFGFTDTNGIWQPSTYAGTYGTNGFYLNFSDNSAATATTIGKDYSGNGNNWTPNNISVTAGVTYDSMTDVPTLTSATAANYAVLNPLSASSYITLSGANLNTQGNTATDEGVCGSTIAVKTGKFYAEFVVTGSIVSNRPNYGIIPNPNANFTNGGAQFANTGGMRYGPDGKVYTSGSLFGTFSTFTTNDIISIAVDADNGAAYVAKNGTWQNSGVPTSGSSKTGAVVTWTGGAVEYFICVDEYNGTTSATNFGQRPFTYTPPTGFVALNTNNLPTPTISNGANYMAANIWTGNGSTQTINNAVNGVSFQPDLVWYKSRSNAGYDYYLEDSVRGVLKWIGSSSTSAELTVANSLTSFNSNGFSLGSDAGGNQNTLTYVGWQWKASGSTVSNTSGSITSTVSAGATQGFSVVTWAGNSTSGATIGHGLGAAPSLLITKSRTNASSWIVGIGNLSGFGVNDYLTLNTTDLVSSSSTFYQAYGSSTFTVGVSAANEMNKTGNNYVTYAFSAVAGYSAFGKYTGNGSTDGPFVYLGFRPRFVMVKSSTVVVNWLVYDTARDAYNVMNAELFPNTSGAEVTASTNDFDFLSNGFKCRRGGTISNQSGETYIYMAFAENPFKLSRAR